MSAVQLEELRGVEGDRRGGPRAAVEEGELAEDVAGAGDGQDDLLARRVLEKQLHLAVPDDEERFARVARLEEPLAGGERPPVDGVREPGAVGGAHVLEEVHAFQRFGLARHSASWVTREFTGAANPCAGGSGIVGRGLRPALRVRGIDS